MTETLKFMARRISETPDEVLMFSFSLLSLVGIVLAAYWFYNRRKIHKLSHQIPASVVKNYLDSIIQNSSALKSSLFRGGGLDVGEGVPSVMPVGDLPTGNVNESSGGTSEEINQKIAEIASLTKRVSDKDRLIRDLESKLEDAQSNTSGGSDNSEEVDMLKDEIKRLKKELSEASESSGSSASDEGLEEQLSAVTQERDELKERLMEYEIIEEDLANLKRLQQENEQLKNQIAGLGKEPNLVDSDDSKDPGPPPQEENPEPEASEPEPEPEPAPETAEEEEDLESAMAAAIGGDDEPSQEEQKEDEAQKEPAKEKKDETSETDQKSAEELLSEFEKMLG